MTLLAQPSLLPELAGLLEPVAVQPDIAPPPEIVIGGRRMRPSPVFDTYWRFAAERQAIYYARLDGEVGPWTSDPILRVHRFTNCYRAADRVSQYLIREVTYAGPQDFAEVAFRTLLFKVFNRIGTWELLQEQIGEPTWRTYRHDDYDRVLSEAFAAGRRLYSAAYVMAPPQLGAARKHTNHLRLVERIMRDGLPGRLQASSTMADAYTLLRDQPGLGDFLAFQFLIDLNYSDGLRFDEMDYVVPGPGARDGIRKCFGRAADGIEADVIRYMAEHQDEHFARLGLTFGGLRGRHLQLIDCQNLFCEVDKYARVAHPGVAGISGRTRIKQRFAPVPTAMTAWFPPKWGLNPAQ
ncbi:nucleotide kinase domain-containing protein [Arsenicicoccus bolidensis]|uniref:5-hmdU DNA kinase helical domain-containing protein n=1 Tax=Arsenicicoccus bolidensis TaxID=229480 RepID=A0ABS9Q0G5_9MICO|nr:nucleotide kinase domain-containing protein [Arsenicicoccus bolidensis]MCG7321346.1 hypothetical protein [Arsenicicoccus bolidensis]